MQHIESALREDQGVLRTNTENDIDHRGIRQRSYRGTRKGGGQRVLSKDALKNFLMCDNTEWKLRILSPFLLNKNKFDDEALVAQRRYSNLGYLRLGPKYTILRSLTQTNFRTFVGPNINFPRMSSTRRRSVLPSDIQTRRRAGILPRSTKLWRDPNSPKVRAAAKVLNISAVLLSMSRKVQKRKGLLSQNGGTSFTFIVPSIQLAVMANVSQFFSLLLFSTFLGCSIKKKLVTVLGWSKTVQVGLPKPDRL
ncbi:hypothetical protein EDB87DRAFT_16494 [Lactarius vividus]|nr:hypothetical protein EDB87DRAFT_16494 [Lactarius vividus]